MGDRIWTGKCRSRSFVAAFVSFCMIFSLLFSFGSPSAFAKSARAAIVVEVNGDVSVRKAGGSKSYTAYEEMSLNQGDVIITGASSAIVLRTADHDDEITVGENAEVSIAELANQGNGKKSRFKMWAGSAWMKVKKLVGAEDDFEIETPTAVMGVRGTSLFTSVDPVTGTTSMTVSSGVVRASTTSPEGNTKGEGSLKQSNHTTLYPSQQITLDSRTEAKDLRVKVEYANVSELVNQSSPKVLEAYLRSLPTVQKENDELTATLARRLSQNQGDNGILKIGSPDDLSKVGKNIKSLVALVAKQAVENKKIDQKLIDQINESIADPAYKLDPSKAEPLDKSAGVDPEVEKLKRQADQTSKPGAEEQAMIARLQQLLSSILAKKKADNAVRDAENKKLEQAANASAREQFLSGLTDEQRKQFLENEKKNEGQTNQQTGSGSGGSSGSGGGRPSGGSIPAPPVLISPQTATTAFNPAVVTMRASAGTTIRLWNGNDIVGSADGNDGQDVPISLQLLAEGTYQLTADVVRGGRISNKTAIPAITISDAPIVVSPTADLVTNSPVVVVKAPLDSQIVVLNEGKPVAAAAGKGAQQEVSIPLPDLGTEKATVYDKLTVVTERGNWRSKEVPLPKLTVDRSMGIGLKSAVRQNDTVTASLTMKNFPEAKALYAVEVHLAYDFRLSYNGDGTVARKPDTVFGALPQSVELLKQSPGSAEMELVYAATDFSPNDSGGSITVKGEQSLVAVPLTLSGTDLNGLKVKLIYYKVVDKNGNVVAEVNRTSNPVEVPVN